jgi:hypothetical protein
VVACAGCWACSRAPEPRHSICPRFQGRLVAVPQRVPLHVPLPCRQAALNTVKLELGHEPLVTDVDAAVLKRGTR